MTGQDEVPEPRQRQPEPQQENTLRELCALVREIASSTDRDIAEAVAWIHSRGL